MANLMALPREIRDMVYIFTLVIPGKVFTPEKAHPILIGGVKRSHSPNISPQQELQKPIVSLLRTCKIIHAEAIPIFYGRNKFQLPASSDITSQSTFKKYAALFGHIIVRFSLYDTPGISEGQIHSIHHDAFYGAFDPDSTISQSSRRIWSKMKSLLLPMTNLKSIYFTADFFQPTTVKVLRLAHRDVLFLEQYATWLLPMLSECFKSLVDGAIGRPGGGLKVTGSITCFDLEEHGEIVERIWETLGLQYDVKSLEQRTRNAYEELWRQVAEDVITR